MQSIGKANRVASGVPWPVRSQRLRRGGGPRVACLVTLLVSFCLAVAGPTGLAAQAPTEFQVKAAYLFNFLKFVEWPEDGGSDPHGKWVIGFIGESPIDGELAHLAEGKNVLGHELLVKKFQAADNLRACNILFITDSEKRRVPAILVALRGSSVLTVADMDNFVGSGGMVQFVVEDARVRVAIDVGATGRAHLKVSSKLLALAQIVSGSERATNN